MNQKIDCWLVFCCSRLAQSIVTTTTGQRHREINLKQIYFEVIDSIIAEFTIRFEENNDILIALQEATKFCNADFNYKSIEPLQRIGLVLPSEAEFKLVKRYLENHSAEDMVQSILKRILPAKDAFEDTFKFFCAIGDILVFCLLYFLFNFVILFLCAETFGTSTINEASFSTLSRIDTKFRFSSGNERLRNLTFLAFEKKMLDKVDDGTIMKEFVTNSERRIQLF